MPPNGVETMTNKLHNLLEDAKAKGFTVETEGTKIRISKRVGRWSEIRGIELFDDGTAFDLSVDLSVTRGMRSYEDMRSVLGI
jgi:hypothetical protein